MSSDRAPQSFYKTTGFSSWSVYGAPFPAVEQVALYPFPVYSLLLPSQLQIIS
jgi:hypothetical protein